jgi:hypothetical protein
LAAPSPHRWRFGPGITDITEGFRRPSADQLVRQFLYIRECFARLRIEARTMQRSGNLGEIGSIECCAPASRKSALHFIKLLIRR